MSPPAARPLADAVSWELFWVALFPLFQWYRTKLSGWPDPRPGRLLVLHTVGVVIGLVVYHGIRLLAG